MFKNLKCWRIIRLMICTFTIYSTVTYTAIITDRFTDNSTVSRLVRSGEKNISHGILSSYVDVQDFLKQNIALKPIGTTAYAETLKAGNLNAKPDTGEESNQSVKEINDVPYISQMPELPTGCEAAASAMLLNWCGVNISKVEIAEALPKGALPCYKNGLLYGSSPYEVFIGNPFSAEGLGVFHKPVADLIKHYLPEQAIDITGISFEQLLEVIDSGRPVITWVTGDMKEPGKMQAWYDENGNKITWKSREHTVVLIGYSKEKAIIINPNNGTRQLYDLDSFKNSWEAMGSQAVTVKTKQIK